MLTALTICFMFLVLIAYNEPYANASDSFVALGSYISQYIALFGALLVSLKADEQLAPGIMKVIIMTSMFAPVGITGGLMLVNFGSKLADKLEEKKAAKAAKAAEEAEEQEREATTAEDEDVNAKLTQAATWP